MQTHLTFSEALEAAKQGKAISREGWNGKGMCVYLNLGSIDIESIPEENRGDSSFRQDGIKIDMFVSRDTGTVTRLPNLNMKSASGATVTGWLASQTDLLADDWCILE